MYFTRCALNPARRGARALLASPHKLHGAVQAAFPPHAASATGQGRVLWRLDQTEHQVQLYLVSPDRPDLTHLIEQAGWPTTTGWDTREYQPVLTRLAAGQMWGFRLKANPVHSGRKTPDAQRSQRFHHVTVAQQTDWLLTRTDKFGFTIPLGENKEPDVAVRGREVVRFERKSATVSLSTVVFEGRLEVVDPDRLRESLTNGIGPAKGYGCGLLTLAPLRRG
ncbi:type I-E CRISPR-associated protein Cas6/Cse3/CasE [Crossiella cryophila]|uniref:CRISPR system Cascade subunit CasE n=1 Tax=Crossiella cryophila TaxID=43355 RepID=A0A7W7C9V2_9PSEU|nr:type I-E CRISPR-associated protein Cas6/Cse3/CasE [Crossiella cryophila]MBB4677188.1 CRISPR system Cascade subunit CasE [Crossiella cryophila]